MLQPISRLTPAARRFYSHLSLRPRLDAEQVLDQKIALATRAVGSAGGAVAGAGDDDEIKILVGLDKRVDHLHRRSGVDVAVKLPG